MFSEWNRFGKRQRHLDRAVLKVNWTNLDASNGWADFETTISDDSMLDAVRGRALSLRLESDTDNELTTHFWFDSLSLVVECR